MEHRMFRYTVFDEMYFGFCTDRGAKVPSARLYMDELRAKHNGKIEVELGPGRIAEPRTYATIGLNPSADPFCDIYMDLENGMPFPDESVDHITSNQFLEHISRDRLIYLMNDFWRVLKPGAEMYHCVPDSRGEYAWADPTHKNVFTSRSFEYFSARPDGTRFVESFSDYGITCNFVTRMKVKPGVDIKVWMKKLKQ